MDAKLSQNVKEIISYSREEAIRLGDDFIGVEHLMLGLIREGEGTAVKNLQKLSLNLFAIRRVPKPA